MKKIIFLLLTLLAACGASAADFKAGGIYYNINEDGKSVSVTSSDDRNELYSGNINIPESVKFNSKKYAVTAIGSYAFDNCTALTSVKLPSSVTRIDDGAFRGCSALSSINIPTAVEHILSSAFQDCSSLTSFVIPPAVTTITPYVFSGCSSLASVSIHDKVDHICEYAFSGCSSLKALIIPEATTYFGTRAFQNCTSLTTVNIPSDSFWIEEYIFAGSGLTDFKIETPWISRFMLADCPELKSLIIPATLSSIGNGGISKCPKLKKVTIEDSPEYLKMKAAERDPEGHPEESNVPVFSTCGIEELYIGRQIGIFDNLTFGESLRSVSFGNYVKDIGSWFHDCYNLAYLSIPESIDKIDAYTFLRCTDLSTINMHRAEPPELFQYSFSSQTYQRATLHIPKGSKQAYSEAPFWKDFLNVADDLEAAGIDGVTADTDNGSFDVYDLQGQLLLRSAGADALSSLAPGIYIKAAGSRTEKIIIR
ncbi:MAG: leucine-rich repeat protein [Muribaculaceae bacterium]|nr:leucine-rich repeat protein [Muribaculaceae bacterium]